MSEIVPAQDIERIVGAARHPFLHLGCPDFVEMWGFDVSADDDYYPHTERFRSDLPVRLGLVDPATGRLTR